MEKITNRSQQVTFIIHPPWWILSRGSFWLFTPIITTDKMVKKRKFPKLTRSTASVSNHSLSGIWWKWLIPASTTNIRSVSHPHTIHGPMGRSNSLALWNTLHCYAYLRNNTCAIRGGLQGIFSSRGGATSRRIHEAIRENAKRKQYAILADRRLILETAVWHKLQAQPAQHDARHEAAHIFFFFFSHTSPTDSIPNTQI